MKKEIAKGGTAQIIRDILGEHEGEAQEQQHTEEEPFESNESRIFSFRNFYNFYIIF